MDTSIPVTEQRHTITTNIDVASPTDILQMLYECDQEIFNGWHNSKGVFDETCLQVADHIADEVATILKDAASNAVVISGSGTSGRLALMVSRTFNAHLVSRGLHPCYDYLMSGGDRASFQAQEAPEDDPFSGRTSLEKACEGKRHSILIGVTCGLSAAYVAGQLDACMAGDLSRCLPALIGFNPLHMARKTPIENWNETFYSVASRLEDTDKEWAAFTLTPIIGPEPISGSTRMKSGSATKILLETIMTAAHQRKFHSQQPCPIPQLIKVYGLIMDAVYADCRRETLAKILALAGDSLNNDGHIYYVAADSLGLVAMVDASECPPTFGADLNDVRGFVKGGYETLANKEGDLSEFMEISTEYFERKIVPTLNDDDLLIFLTQENSYSDIVTVGISRSNAKKVVVQFGKNTEAGTQDDNGDIQVFLEVFLPWDEMCQLVAPTVMEMCGQLYYEMACKWVCNAISTAAHIQRGKVYENVMVDVKVSNTKLFHRAIGIVSLFARCSHELAREALLKAIYETDELSRNQSEDAPSAHIHKASPMKRVVPVALMVAIARCTVSEARALLQESSVIRNAIIRCIQESNKGGS